MELQSHGFMCKQSIEMSRIYYSLPLIEVIWCNLKGLIVGGNPVFHLYLCIEKDSVGCRDLNS